MGFVGRSQHFTFIHVINANCFQNLGFHKVANAGFGHHRNADGGHNLLDHAGVRHAGHATIFADVGRDAFQGHDGAGTCFFSNNSLFGRHYVHNNAPF